jgi:transcriptional regulator with XRE-family HTH domain
MTMKDFLSREYWKWQAGNRNKKLIQFAEYLGVEYGALSAWMNGTRKPKKDNVAKLSEKLGIEVYDIAGLARPGGLAQPVADPDLDFINLNWERTPPEVRKRVTTSIEKAVGNERSEKAQRAVAAPKPSAS